MSESVDLKPYLLVLKFTNLYKTMLIEISLIMKLSYYYFGHFLGPQSVKTQVKSFICSEEPKTTF